MRTARGVGGRQFADDVSTWTSARTNRTRHARLQKALDHTQRWCLKWRMHLNPIKTQHTVFQGMGAGQVKPLTQYGQPIRTKGNITILGVTFDRACTMTHHCKQKAADANRRISLLRMVAGRCWGAGPKAPLMLQAVYPTGHRVRSTGHCWSVLACY